ncbi:MAG: transcription termination factor NusA [Helicobacter sp.]|nr:transcription termination factor NusA [Helicobacter sp.]
MEKILDIVEILAYEKGIPQHMVLEIVKNLILKTVQAEIGQDIDFAIEEDQKVRTLRLIQSIKILPDNSPLIQQNPHNYLSLTEARKIDPSLNVDDVIRSEFSPENMSRNTLNNVFNDLEYHLNRTIEDELYKNFKEKIGKIVSGVVIEIDDAQNTYIEIEDTRAVLPLKNRIKGESFSLGDTLKAILRYIKMDRSGLYIELSRTTPKMLEELMALEVPEIKDGEVIIHKCARIPGDRAKIALSSSNSKIDPIGSAVGIKGVRINSIGRKLNGENIDCIEYSPIPEIFLTRALAPAKVISIQIKDEIALVKLLSSEKSRAIGKNGVNIRLASMITGLEIQIEEKQDEIKEGESEETSVGVSALESLFKN